MNMKKGLVLLGLLVSTAYAQDVSKYTPGITEEGVVYYLPKTEIKVEVTAEKISYTPGELCQYANRYLKMSDVSDKPEVHWEIKNIKVSSVGLPDETNAYSIKIKDKSAASQVELSDEGIIKAINAVALPASENIKSPVAKPTKAIDARSFMTEDILNATSSAKMAELVAKEIYNIRDSRNSLTRGQADYMPKDGAALKIMLDNLNTQEKAMTELFSGVTTKEVKEFTFTVTPDKNITDQVLFRISSKLGIVKADDLAGSPIYISVTDQGVIPPADEKAKKKKMEGVVYNIPGKANISVFSPSKKYCNEELPVTQFGTKEVLTDNLFNKKINTRVIFNPTTGGIVKIDKD